MNMNKQSSINGKLSIHKSPEIGGQVPRGSHMPPPPKPSTQQRELPKGSRMPPPNPPKKG